MLFFGSPLVSSTLRGYLRAVDIATHAAYRLLRGRKIMIVLNRYVLNEGKCRMANIVKIILTYTVPLRDEVGEISRRCSK